MELRAAARLAVVSAAAVGIVTLAYQLHGHDAPAARTEAAPPSGTVAAAAPAAPASTSTQRRLESALPARTPARVETTDGATTVVDESQPHTHVVDPETGGLVSVTGLRGVVPKADDLGPVHDDPLPAGVRPDDPTDTASLLRRAGVTPDPVAAASVVPPGTSSVNSLGAHVSPSCSGTGTDGKRVQVLYVRDAATASRFDAVLPVLRDEVANVDDVFAASAEQTGGLRRVRWVHDAQCLPVIKEVVLPAGSLATFDSSVEALVAAGYDSNERKYLMFTDADAVCGVGSVYTDSRRSSTDNANDKYGGHARVDTRCWSSSTSVAAHELTHTFGGVQGNAPHATKNGHCYDESDLMCYNDGSGVAMKQVCATSQEDLLDCGKDDYFNTAPASGSYLASYWNVARSSYLDTELTDTTPPTVTVASSRTTAETGDRVTFTATASTASTWAWSGATGCSLTASGGTASVLCPSTVVGDVTVTAQATTSTGAVGRGSATVTVARAAAPVATVTAPSTATAGTSFPVSVTGSGKPTLGYAWTAGPCTVAAPTAASTSVTCPSSLSPQDVTVSATVRQADGQTTTGSRTVAVAAPAPTAATTTWTTPVARSGVLSAGLRTVDGAAVPGTPVVLQVLWQGAASYVDLATVTTDSSGLARAAVVYSRAGTFRFVHRATGRADAVSVGTFVKVGTRSSARVPRRKVVGGALARATGERVAGATMVLRKRTSGSTRWVTVTSARTSSTGTVAVAVRPRRLTYYRWTYAGSTSLVASTSGSVGVRP